MRLCFSVMAVCVWVVGCCAGFWLLYRYELTPCPSAQPPAKSMTSWSKAKQPGQLSLVVFAHPKCPCTRATLGELDRLMARCVNKVSAIVFFYKPSGYTDNWSHTDLWKHAEAIPGVQPRVDTDGIEAQRAGAVTSGQAILMDKDGLILFCGGLTSGRGHAGDNSGSASIYSFITTGRSPVKRTPVFGCSLVETKRISTGNKDGL